MKEPPLKRMLISIVLFAALALPLSATAAPAAVPTKLTGTTGPGFTITLRKAGKRVTALKPGRYTLTVTDRSSAHNYVIIGPGIGRKQVTGLAFVGRRTVTFTVRKGRSEYYCTPHRLMGMRGFVSVK